MTPTSCRVYYIWWQAENRDLSAYSVEMAKFDPPERFDMTLPSKWPEWKLRFQRFRTATKLDKDEDQVQIASLIYAMGPEAEHIVKNFAEAECTTFDNLIKQFDSHFIPKKNVIFERAKFRNRVQKPGENVETFIGALYELSENCDFGSAKDDNIRDSIVIGLSDKSVSQQLQMEASLTLATAISKARHSEMVKSQMHEVGAHSGATGTTAAVHSVQRTGNGPGRAYKHAKKPRKPPKDEHSKTCEYCSYDFHPREKCPAKHAKCHKCHRIGHFRTVCRSKQKSVHEVVASHSDEPDNTETYFLGTVNSIVSDTMTVDEVEYEPPWTEWLYVNEKLTLFKVDSGADVCVMTEDTFSGFNVKIQSSKARLEGVSDSLRVQGQFVAEIRGENTPESIRVRIFVVKGATENLVSRAVAKRLNLITRVDMVTCDSEMYEGTGLMKTEPARFKVVTDESKGLTPYSVNTTHRVPIPILDKVKHELNAMENEGIVVKETEATEWCAPMIPVIKPDGKRVRICVDLRKLNKCVVREKYILPTIDDVLHKLSQSTVFSRIDARSGYWMIPLDEESSKYTTFLTPEGRYRFKRLPFGVSCASEIFQRKMTEILGDIDGVVIMQDDVLIHGSTVDIHDAALNEVMTRLKSVGVKLNRDKCEFRKNQTEFLGHLVTKDGVGPHPEKVIAITDMPRPENVTQVRQVMGLFQYLSRFLPNLAEVAKPLNDLLCQDIAWQWESRQEEAWKKLKSMVTTCPVLAYYDVNLPTVVSADASSYGLGAVLLQQHDEGLKPVAYCSRSLTQAEKNYAQVEKELLASVWACEKFQRYLVGLPIFKILTDHKPLVPLMNDRDINQAPIRCQRLLLRLMRFNVVAEYVRGRDMVMADALSRMPLSSQISTTEKEVAAYVKAVRFRQPASDRKLEEIRRCTREDAGIQSAMNYTLLGWPRQKDDVADVAQAYHHVRAELSVANDLLLQGNRIVIPVEMRREILEKIHDGHQGVNKCRERANQSVWWPGLNDEIKSRVANCAHCATYRPTQRHEPMIPTFIPERPWQHIGVDLLTFKKQEYLVAIDYHSRYIELAHMPSTTSFAVIEKMKNMFARWGIPEEVTSDNGPQFNAEEFAKFAETFGFTHTTSSPTFPQSNGEAESGVQIAKKILRDPDPSVALMTYRATPVAAIGCSPAELMMGRRMRTLLPTIPRQLEPVSLDRSAIEAKDTLTKMRYADDYNRRHGVRKLPELEAGEPVRVKLDNEKSWTKEGTIVDQHQSPRSYIVDVGGATYRRNRKHLAKSPTTPVKVADPPLPPKPPLSPDRMSRSHEGATQINFSAEQPTRMSGRAINFLPSTKTMRWLDPRICFTFC